MRQMKRNSEPLERHAVGVFFTPATAGLPERAYVWTRDFYQGAHLFTGG